MKKVYKIILSFILWPLIIAVPQYNLHYASGLASGKLQFRETPVEFYLGLVSGIFGALIFWGLAILISKVISKINKKEIKSYNLFFIISLVFFGITIFTQGENIYKSLTLEESKVREVQQKIERLNKDKGRKKRVLRSRANTAFSKEFKDNFKRECIKNAKVNLSTSKAESYCNCVLGIVMTKYVSESEANEKMLNMNMNDLIELVEPCR